MKVRYQPSVLSQDISPLLTGQKDLAISYLNQYEPNAYHEVSREQSRNTLKDITDKYGFVWDEMGRLSKTKGTTEKPKSQLNQQAGQQTRNGKSVVSKQNKQACSYEQNQNKYLKQEINSINERINQIVNKYKPLPPVECIGKQTSSSSFCRCQHRSRLLTEQDPIQSPYFRNERSSNVVINRSKSTNFLTKHNPRISCEIQEKSAFSPNKIIVENENNANEYMKRIQSPQTKKIDSQIDRINKRIRQCEREKEKLAIDFKRFQVRDNSKTPEKSRISQQQKNNFINKTTTEKYIKAKKPPELSAQVLKIQIKHQETKKNREQKNKDEAILNEESSITLPLEVMKQLQKKIDTSTRKEGIFMRKLEKNGIISKFCRQIELDQQFRNAKLWFENNEDPHKWGIIADKLALEGRQMKYRQLVEKFSCVPQEHNPFFSVKNSYDSYASLLSAYKEDERHWREQIENKFPLQQLVLEQFTAQELDVEQKGGVRVEDFVRFINMRTKNFYRTRDLLLLFQRFAGKEKKQVHFSRVLQTLLS